MTNTSDTRSNQPGQVLHRSGHNRIFAGVAGGLGEHFGINAWWFRWAFIFLSLFAGVGVLVYILAWIVIPGPDMDEPIVAGWVEGVDWSDGGTVFGVVLLGVAGILFATQVIHISGVLVLAAVLFIIGVLLYRGDLKVPQRSETTTTPPSGGVEVDAEGVVDDLVDGESAETNDDPSAVQDAAVAIPVVGDERPATDTLNPPPPVQPKRPRPPKPPRERSMLGRLTIAIGLIVLAIMALVDVSDVAIDIEPFHYFAAAVAVLGLGLVIGAWVGRARWLIFIGIIITPMLWFSMLLPLTWDFSVGEFHHTPVTVEEVGGSYEQGIGQMTIDLNALSATELAEIGTIHASLGLGEMIVRLPDDVGVLLQAEIGAGEVSGPFKTISGIGLDIQREFGPEPRVLVLDLNVGAGTINISGPVGVFDSSDGFNIEWSNS